MKKDNQFSQQTEWYIEWYESRVRPKRIAHYKKGEKAKLLHWIGEILNTDEFLNAGNRYALQLFKNLKKNPKYGKRRSKYGRKIPYIESLSNPLEQKQVYFYFSNQICRIFSHNHFRLEGRRYIKDGVKCKKYTDSDTMEMLLVLYCAKKSNELEKLLDVPDIAYILRQMQLMDIEKVLKNLQTEKIGKIAHETFQEKNLAMN